MRVIKTERILPCLVDPWKIRGIFYLDCELTEHELKKLSELYNGRYVAGLKTALIQVRGREINFFSTGKVAVRLAEDENEAISLINSVLASLQQALLLEEI
ncbi:hypothetical protein [Methermicoccus shengliensis]|uniref:Fe-S cluster protein n=1 Tax=Methermicoccus shengliensis TaxID=660064 RepID=A0A832RZR3_9EURY|nr:hypothetical protein [Methermicoccus shengliensis]KUK04320.1 MAG: Fe-S cluster domain protein [Euryarchaeota archaeon 55_53]KUK30663.1 MAG: Fe-S cluster domain protein [Methanosarcinales archeaon 56_1174]MDI3488212.1 hypothetical protein [Methanosarcinales archaeon]MDN5295487.1 hypothetical protein [Methanosarcinales archaeon]HIH70251.1 hypothetical protein [Methermicoccus shengliensis]